MKRACLAAAFLAAILFAPPAAAQVFGQLTSAEILPLGGHFAGFYLNAADNALGGLTQLRMSLHPGLDFGFQGGIQRVSWQGSDRATLRLGADLRGAIAHSGEGFPVDVALGGGLGVETSDNYHVLTLMPSGIVSRSFPVSDHGSISPYAGLGFAFANVDAGTTQQTFLWFPLRIGANFNVMPGMSLLAEMQFPLGDDFNESFGVTTGVNLPF